MAWTDERIAEMKKHLEDGLSAAEIAHAMGGGLTRNSIIGKVTRLKLKFAYSSRPRKPARPQRRQVIPCPVLMQPAGVVPLALPLALPAERAAPPDGQCTLMELRSHSCRWVLGEVDGTNTMFCGRSQVLGSSYCKEHARICSGGIPRRGRLAFAR